MDMHPFIVFALGLIGGYIFRDYRLYAKNIESEKLAQPELEIGGELKEGEYHPIYIKIDKNEMGGYTSFVYNRHGTHLTKENRKRFVNLLNHMIVKENELRSHKFTLLTFKKDE